MELTTEELEQGLGCWKGIPNCRCKIGFEPADQCEKCRESLKRESRCVCGPNDRR